ncbi:MAG: hypothetical protein QOF20_690 [Acidimicrobiaceae bacterium]|jgi:hypothetical protein|nr:hypothetical protein [Acidimicrobiaceae bacterium]MDQ1368337.1 hypothetical protein [Acidimicrobiaceae bacterium]MDQ1377048.1 hypothetical protein [Acidimicrobiaceae bacterium]MDQ1416096.1 hypothetical protein [Acidimicrobiaceae bacterium]MDQ1419424.1 hypothetical protein [Acidimicrobiaceae bacterium]
MDQPDDQTGRDAEQTPMSDEVARNIGCWAPTIERWTAAGMACFVVTGDGPRPATPDDVADATELLREKRQSSGD